MKHVVMFSGGVGSWAAAKRVAERHGTADLVLLFADVLMEDADTYRFLGEAARNVGGELVRITAGKTPWELFHAQGMMGNSGVDLCSRILKRELMDSWRDANCDRKDTVCYLGIDWSEAHRFFGDSDAEIERKRASGKRPRLGAKRRFAEMGWLLEAPMCEPPYLTKEGMLKLLDAAGIKRPALYDEGFPHANCGGFCVKAGHAHFAHLLKMRPDTYAYHEEQERVFRLTSGKDVSILDDRRGGTSKPLTLQAFRERIEANVSYLDFGDEWGGCGCAIE